MIKINSFFKIDDKFIPLDDFKGPLADNIYVDGALEIIIDDIQVIGKDHWDYIITFWGLVIGGLKECSLKSDTIIGFPDQPSELKFTPQGKKLIVVKFNDKYVTTVDRSKLLENLLDEAKHFYSTLLKINPNDKNYYEEYLKDINSICIE